MKDPLFQGLNSDNNQSEAYMQIKLNVDEHLSNLEWPCCYILMDTIETDPSWE